MFAHRLVFCESRFSVNSEPAIFIPCADAENAVNLTNEDYIISAFCEAVVNNLDNALTWEALTLASGDEIADGYRELRGRKFDENISAGIRAGEWLNRISAGKAN